MEDGRWMKMEPGHFSQQQNTLPTMLTTAAVANIAAAAAVEVKSSIAVGTVVITVPAAAVAAQEVAGLPALAAAGCRNHIRHHCHHRHSNPQRTSFCERCSTLQAKA
jgi:hypothetical protein